MEAEQQLQQPPPATEAAASTATEAATEAAASATTEASDDASGKEVRSPLHKKLKSDSADKDTAIDKDPIMSRDSPRLVLIAVDGGEHSKSAFNFFMRRLRRSDDKFIFVHVQSPPAAVWKDPNEVWHSMVTNARELEKQVAEQWCSGENEVKDSRWVTEFCSGAGAAIVKVAEDNDVDLIVMGSRGLGTVRRTIMGSVSSFVMHHTRVPLIVVPPAVKK